MAEAVSGSLLAVAGLRTALEDMADALVEGSLDRLLACEARLEAALAQLPRHGLPNEARAAARAEIEAARAALARCRRLGLSLDAFIAAGMTARGICGVYGPDATAVSADLRSLNLTV